MNCLFADPVFDSAALRKRMIGAFSQRCHLDSLFRNEDYRYGERTSSVLLLLGEISPEEGSTPEACVILNKRSKEVKQPGDLCCPGGGIEKLDHFLARLLTFRGSNLSKWPCWSELKKEHPEIAQFLSLLYAAGLREAWEEMRLNPFGLVFLGPLPVQFLVLFRRSIHPMVAWVSHQTRFHMSWEVEKIVKFPLRALLDPFNYALYRKYVPPHLEWRFSNPPPLETDAERELTRGRGDAGTRSQNRLPLSPSPHLRVTASPPPLVSPYPYPSSGGGDLGWKTADFPCFIYKIGGRAEILWGVTFKIVTQFLEMIFGFQVPDIQKLPVVPATLDEEYVRKQ